jgi:hypothetical protein
VDPQTEGKPATGSSSKGIRAAPGLTPAEAATLLTDRVVPRDITATMVHLAVRGYVKLEEDNSEGHPGYIIRLMKPRDQWQGLTTYEIDMLFNTFYGGQWTKLSSPKLRFVVAVPSMRAGILNALIDKGMYRVDPVSAQVYRVGLVILAGTFLLAVPSTGWIALYDAGPLAVALVDASALIVYVMGRNLTAKSLAGMRACAAVEGFREFMERVDADRLKLASPKQVERCVPYAMALGVEHNWAEQFLGITKESPEWLVVARAEGIDATRWMRSLGSDGTGGRDRVHSPDADGKISETGARPGAEPWDDRGTKAMSHGLNTAGSHAQRFDFHPGA